MRLKTLYKNGIGITFMLSLSYCHPTKAITENDSNKTGHLLFLEFYENDHVIITEKRKILVDTIITSSPTTGVSYHYTFKSNSIKVKINKDTIFDINTRSNQYNDFIFEKENATYKLYRAKDTIIVLL